MDRAHNKSIGRRILTVSAAASIGLLIGGALTGLVQRHNRRATTRWQAASVAHDSLIEVTTLEAIRAELVSAGQFDRDRLLQLWHEHQYRAKQLLANTDLRDLDRNAVANADRWL